MNACSVPSTCCCSASVCWLAGFCNILTRNSISVLNQILEKVTEYNWTNTRWTAGTVSSSLPLIVPPPPAPGIFYPEMSFNYFFHLFYSFLLYNSFTFPCLWRIVQVRNYWGRAFGPIFIHIQYIYFLNIYYIYISNSI